eukprot:c11746_g1_i1 orf=410-2389(-)
MQGWGGGASVSAGKFPEDEKIDQIVVVGEARRRCALQEHRIALEQDVAKLRKKLNQEIDIHRALERAFRRTVGSLPRLPPYLPAKTQELLAEVAVLEEEVIKLEEHVVSLRQGLYKEAVYISSSKKQKDQSTQAELLSTQKASCFSLPVEAHSFSSRSYQGKRDFVVAKLLPPIKEKEELSLNFPRPSTSQFKKAAHANLFLQRSSCQSKNNLSSTLDRSHVDDSPYCSASPKVNIPDQIKHERAQGTGLDSKQNHEHFPPKFGRLCPVVSVERMAIDQTCLTVDKMIGGQTYNQRMQNGRDMEASSLSQSKRVASITFFKDGDSTEPNRLSEELLRCLLCVYLKLSKPTALSDCDASSTVSHSTHSTASFRSYCSRSSASYNTPMDVSEEIEFRDPYGICAMTGPRDIGPYKHYHDITADAFDYSRIPRSNGLFKRMRGLVNKLSVLDLRGLTHQQKLAFWINIYNICMMHAFLEHGMPCSPHKVVALMRKAVLNIGGHQLNALAIEHFILRLPSHPQNVYLKSETMEKEITMRSAYGLDWPEPSVSFALSCGSQSSPAVRVYTASEVESELETAKKEFLQAAVGVTKKKVLIPKLLEWYMKDFAKDAESLVEWICEQLPSFLRSSLDECLERGNGKALSQIIEVMPYDFNFRYLLAA